ncbi:hypothetical protein FOXG_20426 [Fusarium oxysporum f. sp. lycopersici 4287]|uniref:Uncharacterized protein n=1 Tax=Fusarium oxysporum f. sp. lycopersici (strain 4287 / CBS 123668 / FGSC 9935 / NRRL 34936) TaxID=426428 RepID=A0A0J9WQJ6_FUSO4|nr:hypothetical protein FOXG_20426 [Fusarium oxysporum f. sp. lycopersici 4287]KNB10897.1 hypothetical protein FOXG_20426 [Fusarium oxysporum f. sp. lycopersici 4287]
MGPVLSAICIHRAIDRSIEAPRGLFHYPCIYTARPTAALKPHGACPLSTLYISWQQSRDSLVITDPTTNQPVSGLTMGERTESPFSFHCDLPQLREARTLQQRKLEKPTLVRLSIPVWTRRSRRRSPAIALDRHGLNSSYITLDVQRMSGH